MSQIGAGKPMSQTVVIQQDANTLLQQFLMYGNSSEGYQTFQSGPMDITFTRRFWPTSYIVIAIVGFFLCLIGPLILLSYQNEVFTISMRPGPQPGTTVVAVNGLVSQEMMVRLMMILGQGQLQANTALRGTPNDPMVSADGLYRWDGEAWRPIENAIPPGAPRSPDGQYWWDGQQWRLIVSAGPVDTPVPDSATHLPPPTAGPNLEEPGV